MKFYFIIISAFCYTDENIKMIGSAATYNIGIFERVSF